MTDRVIQPAFAAGELSPALYARVDLAKYRTGAARLRNFFVDYRGGASNRPGTKYLGTSPQAYSPTLPPRLIPFIYSTTATYVIELGNLYARFYSNGAQVVEAGTTITGVTKANPGVVHDVAHGYTTGNEVIISGVGGMTQLNGRNFTVVVTDADHYTLKDLFGNAIDTTNYTTYTSGGIAQRVYTLTTPYAIADVWGIKYTQSADTLTLVHPSYAPQNLTRVSASAFSIAALTYGPVMPPVTSLTAAYTGGAGTLQNWGYVVTAVSGDGKEESLPCFPAVQQSPLLDGRNNMMKLAWTPPAAQVSHYNVYKWGPIRTDTPIGTVFGYIGQTLATSYTDTGIAPDFSKLPPQFNDPFTPGQVSYLTVSAAGSFAANTFLVALTVTGGTGSGLAGYAVIDPATNACVGSVITSPGSYTVAPTVKALAGGGHTDATFTVTLGQATGTYPSTATYFQQRRVFANTVNNPQSMVLSQPGNYSNFDTTPVSLADDSITASLASRQVNAVESMVPMSTGLVVLTTGSGFLVSGGNAQSAITPNSLVALPQASSGANALPPLVINYDILYCQNRGAVVRDLAFNFYVQSYTGTDRSVLASHLFLGHTLTDWTWAEEPFRLVHVVREDGYLLSMAYVPEQDVWAWSWSDTQGQFISITSVPEGQVNAVYVLVSRLVQGVWKYYVERFDDRLFDCLYEAWFLDSALSAAIANPSYTLTPSSISGSTPNSITLIAS